MTTFAPGRVRVELWDDLPAAGGVRRAFVSGTQSVLSVVTPDQLDFSVQAELALVPRPDLVTALETYPLAIWRLVPLNDDGTISASDPIEHYRVRTWELALAAGQATLTVGATHPLLDWDAVGQCRTVTTGGITTYVLTGDYTPAQALGIALSRVTATGRTYWALDTISRSDVKTVAIEGSTPLEVARKAAELWDSELSYRVNGAETQHLVGLQSRVGAGALVPTLRFEDSGALLAVTRRLDTTDVAHEVEPLGAANVTMARAGWSVEAIAPPIIQIKDPSGGFGPAQISGQFDGRYIRDTAGGLHQILLTTVVDLYTTQIQLASVAAFAVSTPRQHVEICADASGTLLTSVADPTVSASKRVSVTLQRTDLTGDRNYVPNARGQAGSPPTLWAFGGAGGSFTRGTPPAGCPIGDDGSGQMWKATINPAGHLQLPSTNVLDVPNGDSQLVGSVWAYLVAGAPGDDLTIGVAGGSGAVTLAQANAGVWMRLDVSATLATAQASYILIDNGTSVNNIDVWIAGGMIQRATGGTPTWTEYERPRVNVLVQAANGHLLGHRKIPAGYTRLTVDERVLAGAGTPLVLGGDVRIVVPDFGIAATARYEGRRRARHANAPSDLTVVEAPDPAVAQLVGSAAPSRPLSLTELLVRTAPSSGA